MKRLLSAILVLTCVCTTSLEETVIVSASDLETVNQTIETESNNSFVNQVSFDFAKNLSEEYQVLCSSEIVQMNMIKDETNKSLSYTLTDCGAKDDLLLIHFTASSDGDVGKIKVSMNNTNGTYILPSSQTEYVLPYVSNGSYLNLTITLLSDNESVDMGELEILNAKTQSVNEIDTGLFDISDTYTTDEIDDSLGSGTASCDTLLDGNYLYSVNKGSLFIYEVSDQNNLSLVSELEHLGNTRDIALCEAKNVIAVSSRENGVFLVSVEDKTNPSVLSNIPTFGLATGISVNNGYLFISERNQGVEIYNISDYCNPKYCSTIVDDGYEAYDCCVDGNYVYISNWAEKRVQIYNISNVSNPVKVSRIDLNGCGGGCTVSNGLLYVATGYNTQDEKKTLTSPGCGTGNGMDIFDVSDPANPQWISTTKDDGRYYYSGFDHWRISVSGNYAYLSGIYNGVYIYDISNPSQPVRVKKIEINIPTDSVNYKNVASSKYLFPFNCSECLKGIVSSVAVGDNNIFIGTTNCNNGIFSVAFDSAVSQSTSDSNQYNWSEVNENTFTYDNNLKNYDLGKCVFDIEKYNDSFVLACGTDGIVITDNNFNVLKQVNTEGNVIDIKLSGDYVITAEGNAGIGIYQWDDNQGLNLIKRLEWDSYNSYISAIELFAGNSKMIAQCGFATYALIDISDLANASVIKTYKTGSLYAKGITADGDYATLYSRSQVVTWKNNESKGLTRSSDITNNLGYQSSYICMDDGIEYVLYNGGYVYFSVGDSDISQISDMTVHKVDGYTLSGNIFVSGDYMLVSNNTQNKITVLDISEKDNPSVLASYNLPCDSLEPYVDDEVIVIPLEHLGLVTLDKSIFEAEKVLNVKDFGAVGDGITDDTEAIKKAFIAANGEKLYFPEGTYCITSIDCSNIAVNCYANGDAWIKKTNHETSPMITFRNCTSGLVQGLKFDAGCLEFGDDYNTACLYFRNSFNIEVTDCYFQNCSREATAFLGDCANVNVNHCEFYNTSAVMWLANGSIRHVIFENNTATDGKINGIEIAEKETVNDSYDVIIRNNSFTNFINGSIVQMRNVSDIEIYNNQLNNVKNFILCAYPVNTTEEAYQNVSKVKVHDNTGEAKYFIYLYSHEDSGKNIYENWNIENNEFELSKGLMIDDINDISLSENTFEIDASATILVSNSEKINLDSNNISSEKSSKSLFIFKNDTDIQINNMTNSSMRTLFGILGEVTDISLQSVATNFSIFNDEILYSDKMFSNIENCTNTGKDIPIKIADGQLQIPIIGEKFVLNQTTEIEINKITGFSYGNRNVIIENPYATIKFKVLEKEIEKGENVTLIYDQGWKIENTELKVSDSSDCKTLSGDTATFEVKVSGGSGTYSYQWYKSSDNGVTWNKTSYTGAKTSKLSFTMKDYMYKYSFKCLVTDSNGESLYSNELHLIKTNIVIEQQPADAEVQNSSNASFIVEVLGNVKSYQWYKSTDGGNTWTKTSYTGAKTNSLSVPAKKYMDGYYFYCVITDTDGNQYKTNSAKLIVN